MKPEYTFAWCAWLAVLGWALLAAPDFRPTLGFVAVVLFLALVLPIRRHGRGP